MIKAVMAGRTSRLPALDSPVSDNDPAGFINGLSKWYLFILEDSPEIFEDMLGYLSLQMLVFDIEAGFALSRASTAQCPDSL